MEPRIAVLKERTVCVVPHRGPSDAVDATRRPLYRHMVIHELVGGPSILRFLDAPVGDRVVDALVMTHTGFEGDAVCLVEVLPGGTYAVLDYEGPEQGLGVARTRLRAWAGRNSVRLLGPVLQVHHMDPIDGILEAQLQVRVECPPQNR